MSICNSCLWSENCSGSTLCEYYTPAEEYFENNASTEKERYIFRKEWFSYIERDERD